MSYSRKNPNMGGRGHTFSRGYCRKSIWKFQGSIENEVEFSRVLKEKLMWNFHESWFLTLEFQRVVTQFCRISMGESLFSGISKGKVTNLKILEVGFPEKYTLNPTCFRE